MRKRFLPVILSVTMAVSMIPAQAAACTAVYVGSDVSDDGTTILARSNDAHPANDYQTEVVIDRVENQPGRIIQGDSGIKYRLPDTTFQYTAMPMDTSNGSGRYSSLCMNEFGMGISVSVTAYVSPEIEKADPYIENGFCEDVFSDAIACQCKTAREGVKLIGEIIEEYGNAQANIAMLADRKEAWYVECYSGHQWAAVKMPKDKVAAFGNEFMLQTEYNRHDKDGFMCSKGCFSMPKKAGLAVYKKGKMSLCETYGGKGRLADYANLRTYMGHTRMAPSTAGKYETQKRYPLFYKPDTKIGLDNVFEIMRYRFEGTEYSPDETGADNRRVIGTETQQSVHALQVYKNKPKSLSLVGWQCLANAEHSVFIPISSLITDTAEPYKDTGKPASDTKETGDQIANNNGFTDCYDDSRAGVCFKRLCALAEQDREMYGEGVRSYWHLKELKLIKEYPEVLSKAEKIYSDSPVKAEKYITDYTIELQNSTLDEANKIYEDLMWYIMGTTDTLKHNFDYSTLQMNKKTEKVKPFIPSGIQY